MTRLRLTLDSFRRADQPSGYLPLLPDETVVSWADRQPGVQLSSDSQEERTFGTLTIDLPKFPAILQRQLQRAAQPPDAWLLHSRQRTLVCARCLAEDLIQGLPPYDRRAWCVTWRTCCPRHGPLFDTDNRRTPPGWTSLLDGSRWTGQELDIVHTRPHVVLLTFSLGADRRAIHLEAALAGRRRGAWFPRGLTSTSLRAIYCDIVSDLLQQFYLAHDGPEDQLPNPGFNRALNGNRFAINVLVEAILSVWTSTPLPASVLALRTPLLVRAIGWGEERPQSVRANQVLFRGPSARAVPLVRYAQHLRASDYAQLIAPTDDVHVGYLTRPETRLIGLSVIDALSRLAQMTRQGQFLAFDARRGRLTENKFLPELARLRPEETPKDVILPAWAYRPSTPRRKIAIAADDLRYLFGQRPPDDELRWAAPQRRWRHEERKSVRFSHRAW